MADSGADARPQPKPQPRVRQKLTKPDGPLKRQAQRHSADRDDLAADAEGTTVSQRRRAAQRQALEAGILAAARALFDERGADALTLREVGAAVGYSHATLYSFFADKNALLARLAQESLEKLLMRLEGARDGAGDALADAVAERADGGTDAAAGVAGDMSAPAEGAAAATGVGGIAAVARAFVQWGMQHPHDYRLLMLNTPDGLTPAVVAGLDALVKAPPAQAAALWAGLHGLVLLGQSGLQALGGGATRAQRLAALLDGLFPHPR